MYVTSRELVRSAREGGYAVPAFNAENLEMIQGIIEAAEEARSPVLIQTTPSTVRYLTLYEAVAMVRSMAERVSVPIALHLDHCESYEGIVDAIREGYSSVMIDGSKLPYKENVDLVCRVMAYAHAAGIPVEAELGTVGGKEDSHSAGNQYTDPAQAEDFFRRTGIDLFAVAIGTAHGFYRGEPKLDFDLLTEVSSRIDVPLVLHGASGLSDETVRRAVSLGISKVNFATELRAAATAAVRHALADENIYDPKKYMGPAREAVRELCIGKIRLCGSDNKS